MDENEVHEVYSSDPERESWCVDLESIVLCMQEEGYTEDGIIYVFTCAEGWHEMPGGGIEWTEPEGFEPRLIRTLTLAEAISEVSKGE